MKLTATDLISNIARSADWIAAEYNNESSPSTFYSVGSATTSSPSTTIATYFAHSDHVGSRRVLTDINGSGYDNFDYLPFCETRSSGWGTTHKFTGPAQLCGKRDSETNSTRLLRPNAFDRDHTLFRQYSSSLGRWSSPDPLAGDISDPQSLNRYTYVGNNPLAYVDPLGADAEIVTPGAGHPCTYDAYQGVDACGDLCARGNSSCSEASDGGISFSVGFGLTSDPGPFGEINGLPPGVSVPPITLRSLIFPDQQCDFGPCYGNSWGQNKGSGYEDEHGNACTPSVLDDLTGRSCKRPTCIGVFARAGAEMGDKLLPNIPGSNPEDMIAEGAKAVAAAHIIARGLVVPLRSSIVRNILLGGAEWATAAAAATIIIQEVAGLAAEAKAWWKGSCRSIWEAK